jgi:hypothetical protein
MTKQQSTAAYWYEFADGSDLQVRAFFPDDYQVIQSHERRWKEIKDDVVLKVTIKKSRIDSSLSSPIGTIVSRRAYEEKELTMTAKQYKELVCRFWENGYDYYDEV